MTYDFGDATILWEHRQWTQHGIEGRSAAVAFYGDQGTLIVDRSGWKVYDRKESLTAGASELLESHFRNFAAAIRDQEPLACDLSTGHMSSTLAHLGNISHRLGREVRFDPQSETFNDDRAANALLAREYRPPWTLPGSINA